MNLDYYETLALIYVISSMFLHITIFYERFWFFGLPGQIRHLMRHQNGLEKENESLRIANDKYFLENYRLKHEAEKKSKGYK